MPEFRQWPDDFPAVSPSTDFDVALVAFFDCMVESGASVYVDEGWSLFSFSRGKRMIDFVRRGKLRRGAGMCWEVWPYDDGKSLRLGPKFGLRDYACVVISGIDDVRTVTESWLDGKALDDLLKAATFWDKKEASKPLEASM
jgi:hypothetical protein